MGTSGSLDGQQRLVIKRFAPKNFEAILRRYIVCAYSLEEKKENVNI
uniref:Pco083605 n=1 Tax=Arundo donax TaxID=35708 RepID=A0A0A9FUC8_ARUDO